MKFINLGDSLRRKPNALMKATLTFLTFIMAYTLTATPAFAQFDENALPDPISNGPVEVINPGGDTVTDFNDAINNIRNQTSGSGTILFKAGNYSWNRLTLADNIHVRLEPGVTVTLTGPNGRAFALNDGTENCSVEGTDPNDLPIIIMEAYDAQIGDIFAISAISYSADNCRIANLKFVSRGSNGNVINMGYTAKNLTIDNVHSVPFNGGEVGYTSESDTPLLPGWSVVQIQGVENIEIDNISGYGGITLRLEQNNAPVGTMGIVNLTANNVVNYNGRGALFLGPTGGILEGGNRDLTVTNVTSYGAGWAVFVGASVREDELGTFENVSLSNVQAYYGHNAQFRWDEKRNFLPPSLDSLATELDIEAANLFYSGPSLGPVWNNYSDWAIINNVEWFGFPSVFDFNEDGTVSDDGTDVVPMTYSFPGRSYDGASGNTIPHNSELSVAAENRNFAVEFCVQPEQGPTGEWRAVVHKGSSSDERTFAMWLRPSDMHLHYATSTATDWSLGGNSSIELPLDFPTKVSYVRDGDKLKLYLNGVLDSEIALTDRVLSNTGALHIGDSPWYDGIVGQISDFNVYGNAILPEIGGCTINIVPTSVDLMQADAQNENRFVGRTAIHVFGYLLIILTTISLFVQNRQSI